MENNDEIGQTIQSSDFAFQNCVGQEVIQIRELKFTKPEQIEEANKIFEGLSTMVNIKHKEPARLERTPVILTCNQGPWTGFENERFTLENRKFKHLNLPPSEVLSGLGDRGPYPGFYLEVFDYIRTEVTYDVLWPPVPYSEQWHLIVEKLTEKLNEIHDRTLTLDEHITNHIIRYRREDGNLIGPANTIEHPMTDTLSKLDITRYDIHDRNYSLAGKLMTWMSKLRDENNTDYYFDFTDYRRPKIYSSLTKREYDPTTDRDEADFSSFKRGYTIIQRVLLRTRVWPNFPPKNPSVEDKIHFMLKVCL